MEPLPRSFLKEIARKYDLSEEQATVFIKFFSSNNPSQQEIAESLNISSSAFSTRMTGVYQKFNFKQRKPNKSRLLHDFLWKEFHKSNNNKSIANFAKSAENIQQSEIDINALVNKLREQVKKDIETRCGEMRILDMSQPIGLGKIYTQVNILEKISGRRRKDIAELITSCNLEYFERFNFGRVTEEKIPGEEAVTKYSKIFILGKPGAGKTTFLKHLVIQCNSGSFQSELVPFFVTLKYFAEAENKPSLLDYLHQYIEQQDDEIFRQILKKGKALICLDGLDEVLEENSQRVIREIEKLTNKYPDNQYLIACRIAAQEYTFSQFTEVEIADFDWQQITFFANNWFKNKVIKAQTFLSRLETNEPIKELASSPLLLTLLCIYFEEVKYFPANRARLYEEGLYVLLKKWDTTRGITRDEIYKKLWVKRKEDLLSQIARATFAEGEYFFKQDKVERHISEYIRNLPGASNDEKALKLDSEAVLKSIEAQHGLLVERAKKIYSFSHLTFQEYFTAREIIIVRQSSEEALQELVSHLFDKRWREVFLLSVAMSSNAERLVLLMKEKIDDFLAEDRELQNYLQWLNEKTTAVDIRYSQEDSQKIQDNYEFYANINNSISRIIYLNFDLGFNLNLELHFNFNFNFFLISRNFDLDRNLILDLYLYQKLDFYRIFRNFDLDRNHDLKLAKECDSQLYEVLLKLKERLPDEDNTNKTEFKEWWQKNGQAWSEDFRNAMITYQNIGHDWQFSEEQKALLEQYYRANQFLTQCLHHECYVSREVRQEIEETLLLPIAEIEKRKYQ